jgi:hypothetical protein
MKTCKHGLNLIASILICCFAGASFIQPALAASTDIANVPMAVKNSVTPNVQVILDNSESMDGYMAGTLVSGSDPNTRGNIGRLAMRNAITSYRTAFNWGLMSFGIGGAGLYSTYVYLLGTDSGMVFTDDCVGYVPGVFNGTPFTPGISASNPSALYPSRRAVAMSLSIYPRMIPISLTFFITGVMGARRQSAKPGRPQPTHLILQPTIGIYHTIHPPHGRTRLPPSAAPGFPRH